MKYSYLLVILFLFASCQSTTKFEGAYSECNNVSEELQEQCRMQIENDLLFDQAVTNQEHELCLSINSSRHTYRCLENISIQTENPWLCNNVSDLYRDQCFLSHPASIDICDTIHNNRAEITCLERLAVQEKEPAHCLLINSSGFETNCLSAVLRSTTDVDFCEQFKDEQYASAWFRNCLFFAAQNIPDANICLDIDYAPQREGCISSVAGVLDDISVCDLSSNQNKQVCINNVEQNR